LATVTTRDPARAYHRWQFRIGVSRYPISAAYLGALLVTGLSTHLRDVLTAWTSRWWLTVPIAVLLIALGQQVLTLPLSLIGGFWLPRRYGLHHQSFLRWAIDRGKAGLIGIALGGAAVLIVYALLRSTPWWWLWAAGALFVGQVLIAFVTPI
jgi:CAAX prenyl protease-like protein